METTQSKKQRRVTQIMDFWESHEGWIYTGHGHWEKEEDDSSSSTQPCRIEQETEWMTMWLENNHPDIQINQKVLELGYPNRWGARIQVNSRWNLELFQELLQDYEDNEVVEWLRYGWPTGRLPTLRAPAHCTKSHKGATEHLQQLKKYIRKEKKYGAVMGPFNKIPFRGKVGISPLSTRPKKGTEDRGVILDLSFPLGGSVNDGIPKDTYLGLAGCQAHLP